MSKNLLAGLVVVVATTFLGCGGGDDTTSTTTDDMAMKLFKVQSGTYNVSNLVVGTDSCMLGLSTTGTNPFATLAVVNDGNGNVKLGTMRGPSDPPPSYTPAAYSQGSGTFTDSYHATTTMTTMVTADTSAMCTYNMTRTNTITVVGDNMLNISFSQMTSNRLAACMPAVGTSCTSTYTFTLQMPVT
ncbi:MAG: hypothetical protein JWN44_3580 [Myxococcales bacterium]|nr:hypothetical protein [Myxococcales bacterium]